MADTKDAEQGDPGLEALTTLSEVASASATELNVVGDELIAMKQRRRRGWSWHRILSSSSSSSLFSDVARIVARLGGASGAFRRTAAQALQREGMQVKDIASLFAVTRQRVSALIHPQRKT
jgi:hypothetical protein